MTAEIKAKFIGALQVAGFFSVAANYLGLSERTIRDARQKDPEFSADIEKALAKRTMYSITRIRNSQAWQAHAWWLERTDPARFGRRVALEHSGPDGGPIESKTTFTREDFKDLTTEELLDLRDQVRERVGGQETVNRIAHLNKN